MAPFYWVMLLGRIISGAGIGFLSSIVPLFQSECSPHEQRGLYGSIEFTGNILGFSSSIWLDFGCSYISGTASWRVPLVVQVLLGIILFLGGFALVESPRYLLTKNRDKEGFRVLRLFHDDDELLEPGKSKREFLVIKRSIEADRQRIQKKDRSFFNVIRNNKKRILIGSSTLIFAQTNGINLVSYYQPMIFKQIGFKGRSSFLLSGINGLIYLASTIIPWFIMDNRRIGGRRKLFIVGGIIMGLCLCLAGIFTAFDSQIGSILCAVVIVGYMATFGITWGPVGWLYNSEIYSDSYTRAVGTALGSAGNWISNFVVGEISPALLDLITWRLYFIYGASCFISVFVAYKCYPETAGVELEDMDELFSNFYHKKRRNIEK
ncbi:unnamed protein product [Ambrosiozyma monospora]|uniref:Unnamed protein product n=1 Tax=Ambrosiozyma monospora TaxID=43982 RepID=A0A9W6Z675_AMBMO|nr:unnamed protein product [Ambrosiozyma monospora]